MNYRNRLGPLGRPLSYAEFVDCMKNVRAIVPVATAIANANGHVFQNDEPVLVFKRFPLDGPRLHRAFTIFATISVHNPNSSQYRNL